MANHPRSSVLRWTISVVAFALALQIDSAQARVEQPEGYRMGDYDSEVPAALDGARTIGAAEVRRLQQTAAAAVIDVIPEQRRPQQLPENQIWLPVAHEGIPGAIWLPDTGYGVLSEVTENYFKRNLLAASNANRNHPLIFYCRANCWMSWNAAKRALSYGYTQVYWFSDGTDGWLLENYAFEVLTPAAGQRQPGLPGE